MAAGRYTAAQRATATAHVAEHGLASAAKTLGVGKGTLTRWCRKAGVSTAAATEKAQRAAVTAAEASRAARLAVLEESRLRRIDALTTLADDAIAGASELVAAARESHDPRHLSAVIGAFTRAIHDLALEQGEPTERAGFVVELGYEVAEPDADVSHAVPEDELADWRRKREAKR